MVETVWRDFHQQLLNFIIKQVSDIDAAEDILQEVFIKISQRIEQLENDEKLVSWLYAICRNTIYDYYRKNKAIKTIELQVNLEEFTDDEYTHSNHDSLKKCLATLISELDDKYRQVLEDSELYGHKQAFIADKNHLSLSATKSRIGRGKSQLKDKLKRCCEFDFAEHGIAHYCKRNCGCQ